MSSDLEKLANDFLVKLTWGGQDLCPEIIKENPEILDTKHMAATISPNNIGVNPSPDLYNLAFRVVDTLCEYRDKGIISEEQFKKTINTPSFETGETLLTSILKETLKAAQKVEKISDKFWKSEAIKNLNGFSSRLRDLIDQNGKIRADMNVPNLRGQYPLELIRSMSDGEHLHNLLTTEHNCILAATNPAIEAKIKHGITGKSDIEKVEDKALPKIKALLLRTGIDPNDPKNANNWEVQNPDDVSVLKVEKPSYLASETKDALSIARIREPGEYLLRTITDSPSVYEISKLNKEHNTHLYLNHGGKWNEVPQDKIYDTVTALNSRSGNGKVKE